MVVFIRDNECFEPRVKNYLRFLEKNNVEYHVIAWNRSGTAEINENITYFQRRAEYGKRIANIPNKLFWMCFVVKEIFKHRKKCQAIHACDVDAVIPALLIGKLLRKKVIFDIFDWISSINEKGIVYKLVDWLQNIAYKHSDAVIVCEDERKTQARSKNKRNKVLVLPNIPNVGELDNVTRDQIRDFRSAYSYTLSYVGVFDRDRGLEHLLESVSKCPDVILNIAGFGVLDELVTEYSNDYSNICYWGRVDYSVGQSIMKESDLIIAMYYLTNPVHKLAAPNKYYESLALGVPMVTTANTLVGSKVAKYDTGFVLDETADALSALLLDEKLKELIKIKKNNCSETWKNVYCKYHDEFMHNEYMELLESGK